MAVNSKHKVVKGRSLNEYKKKYGGSYNKGKVVSYNNEQAQLLNHAKKKRLYEVNELGETKYYEAPKRHSRGFKAFVITSLCLVCACAIVVPTTLHFLAHQEVHESAVDFSATDPEVLEMVEISNKNLLPGQEYNTTIKIREDLKGEKVVSDVKVYDDTLQFTNGELVKNTDFTFNKETGALKIKADKVKASLKIKIIVKNSFEKLVRFNSDSVEFNANNHSIKIEFAQGAEIPIDFKVVYAYLGEEKVNAPFAFMNVGIYNITARMYSKYFDDYELSAKLIITKGEASQDYFVLDNNTFTYDGKAHNPKIKLAKDAPIVGDYSISETTYTYFDLDAKRYLPIAPEDITEAIFESEHPYLAHAKATFDNYKDLDIELPFIINPAAWPSHIDYDPGEAEYTTEDRYELKTVDPEDYGIIGDTIVSYSLNESTYQLDNIFNMHLNATEVGYPVRVKFENPNYVDKSKEYNASKRFIVHKSEDPVPSDLFTLVNLKGASIVWDNENHGADLFEVRVKEGAEVIVGEYTIDDIIYTNKETGATSTSIREIGKYDVSVNIHLQNYDDIKLTDPNGFEITYRDWPEGYDDWSAQDDEVEYNAEGVYTLNSYNPSEKGILGDTKVTYELNGVSQVANPKFTNPNLLPSTYSAKLLVENSHYKDPEDGSIGSFVVNSSFVIVKADPTPIKDRYQWSTPLTEFMWTGNAQSLPVLINKSGVIVPGEQISTKYYKDNHGTKGEEVVTPIEIGEYIAEGIVTTIGYQDIVKSQQFKIIPRTWPNKLTYIPGEADFNVNGTYTLATYKPSVDSILGTTEVQYKFGDKEFNANPVITDASLNVGEYQIQIRLKNSHYVTGDEWKIYNVGSFKINPADPTPIKDQFQLSLKNGYTSTTIEWDGNSHTPFEVTETYEGDYDAGDIKYYTASGSLVGTSISEIGTYTAKVDITPKNYKSFTLSRTFTITYREWPTDMTYNPGTKPYNAATNYAVNAFTVPSTIKGQTDVKYQFVKDGTVVTQYQSDTYFTNTGATPNSNVLVNVKLTNEHYKSGEVVVSGIFVITKGDPTPIADNYDWSTTDREFAYGTAFAGLPHYINKTGVKEEGEQITTIYKDASGNQVLSPTEIGTYTAEATVTFDYYTTITVPQITFKIVPLAWKDSIHYAASQTLTYNTRDVYTIAAYDPKNVDDNFVGDTKVTYHITNIAGQPYFHAESLYPIFEGKGIPVGTYDIEIHLENALYAGGEKTYRFAEGLTIEPRDSHAEVTLTHDGETILGTVGEALPSDTFDYDIDLKDAEGEAITHNLKWYKSTNDGVTWVEAGDLPTTFSVDTVKYCLAGSIVFTSGTYKPVTIEKGVHTVTIGPVTHTISTTGVSCSIEYPLGPVVIYEGVETPDHDANLHWNVMANEGFQFVRKGTDAETIAHYISFEAGSKIDVSNIDIDLIERVDNRYFSFYIKIDYDSSFGDSLITITPDPVAP